VRSSGWRVVEEARADLAAGDGRAALAAVRAFEIGEAIAAEAFHPGAMIAELEHPAGPWRMDDEEALRAACAAIGAHPLGDCTCGAQRSPGAPAGASASSAWTAAGRRVRAAPKTGTTTKAPDRRPPPARAVARARRPAYGRRVS
jgi:hypothetical protein